MAKKKIPPRVHTLVICDYVELSSEEADVLHLFGVRSRLEADSFPFFQPHLSVFLQVSGYPGQASGRIVLVLARSDEQVDEWPLPLMSFLGPLELIPLHVELTDCVFPEAGLYYIQVYFSDMLLSERWLHLYPSGHADNG
jgi:hypothetical protein